MSAPTSTSDRTMTVAQYAYRNQNLWFNAVKFMEYEDFVTHPLSQRFRGQVDSLLQLLETSLDTTVTISPEQVAAMQQHRETIIFQEGGYHNAACIEKAFELRLIAKSLKYAQENQWTDFFSPLWAFFDMKNTFSWSQDNLWRGYDIPIMQLIVGRAQLVRPKPDFAFGLRYDLESRVSERLLKWVDASIPPVDPFVYPQLSIPFFLVESKSINGSQQTAENELANGMVQAHDILCSLGVEDRLFVLGAVQVSTSIRLYISLSTSRREDKKTFTKKIDIIELDTCNLTQFQGCLKFLKYIEWAKAYGLGLLKETVESVLASTCEALERESAASQ